MLSQCLRPGWALTVAWEAGTYNFIFPTNGNSSLSGQTFPILQGIHQLLKMLLTRSHINYWCRSVYPYLLFISGSVHFWMKREAFHEMTNKNNFISVSRCSLQNLFFIGIKRHPSIKALIPLRVSVFKWAKPASPQQQTLWFREKQNHVWI